MKFETSSYYKMMHPHFSHIGKKIIASPINLIYEKDVDWGIWQGVLRFIAKDNQNYKCPVCNKFLRSGNQLELHHALISRENIRGLPRPFRSLIHHTYNCILLHTECHNINRQQGWKILTDIYGKDVIIAWYEGLPDKILRMDWQVWEDESNE